MDRRAVLKKIFTRHTIVTVSEVTQELEYDLNDENKLTGNLYSWIHLIVVSEQSFNSYCCSQCKQELRKQINGNARKIT